MKLRALFLFFVLTLVIPAVAAAQTSSTNVSKAPLPLCTISSNIGAVYIGQSVTLTWASQYATAGTITSLGSVGPSGAQGVIPTAYSHKFVGTFTGPGGTATCSVDIGILQGNPSGVDNGTGPSPVAPVASTQIKTGTGLIPCNGTDCQACHLAGLAQNIINWLVGISIPLAAAMFAYAGIIYFSSGAGFAGKIDDAHKIFQNVGIGFLIVLCAWLGIQTILKAVLSPGFYQSWNEIKCVDDSRRPTTSTIQQALNAIPFLRTVVDPTVPQGYNNGYATLPSGFQLDDSGNVVPTGDQGIIPPSGFQLDSQGNIVPVVGDSASIAYAAGSYTGQDTSAGPDEGNLACAWAVNNVLKTAGVAPIDGDSVFGMEQGLKNGRGTPVSTSDAQQGDIIVWKDDSVGVSHVGICKDAGCSTAISNSSSAASFTNLSGSTLMGVPGRVYRVNK